MSTQTSFRRASADDAEHIRWALYEALAWNPERELTPPEATLEHPRGSPLSPRLGPSRRRRRDGERR
jgi:hypothetical protein